LRFSFFLQRCKAQNSVTFDIVINILIAVYGIPQVFNYGSLYLKYKKAPNNPIGSFGVTRDTL